MNLLTAQYIFLAYCWVLYCVVHSFLADERIKGKIQKIMKENYKYYRPIYAIFATVTLIGVLWFHFSISSSKMFSPRVIIIGAGYLIAFFGVIVMAICIKKYFYELSGLQALNNEHATNTLQTNGLHKFVRHPLYFGTLTFIWGFVVAMPFVNHLIAAIIITIYVWIGITAEEKKLVKEYGEQYVSYRQRVPKLIPFIH